MAVSSRSSCRKMQRPVTSKPCTNMPSTTPCANVAIVDPKKNARSHQWRCAVSFRRNSKATPRKMRPSSISSNGKYTAGMMIANASGKIASSPSPPSTSHVSLPSHTGATDVIISVRASSSRAIGKRMPMPRSKPSSNTYMNTETPRMIVHTGTRSRGGMAASLRRRLQRPTAAAPDARPASARAVPRARVDPHVQGGPCRRFPRRIRSGKRSHTATATAARPRP